MVTFPATSVPPALQRLPASEAVSFSSRSKVTVLAGGVGGKLCGVEGSKSWEEKVVGWNGGVRFWLFGYGLVIWLWFGYLAIVWV